MKVMWALQYQYQMERERYPVDVHRNYSRLYCIGDQQICISSNGCEQI